MRFRPRRPYSFRSSQRAPQYGLRLSTCAASPRAPRLHRWAWRVRYRHANLVVLGLPRRDRWTLYLAVAVTDPKQLVSWVRSRFVRWAALPGDRWVCATRCVEGVVIRVDHQGVTLDVCSRVFLADGRAAGWPERLPPGAQRSYEFVAHGDWNWWPK